MATITTTTVTTLAELKAAATSQGSIVHDASLWTWTPGNYAGKADNINVVKADTQPLTAGAWVRLRAEHVVFDQASTVAIPRKVSDKLRETVSIADFGATTAAADNVDAIQRAIDAVAAAGGGEVHVPAGTYRIGTPVLVKSGVRLAGTGVASVLKLIAVERVDAVRLYGSSTNPIEDAAVALLRISGDARYVNNDHTVTNGNGINTEFANRCVVDQVWVDGFSDGGIAFFNSSYNIVSNSHVSETAQGISFNAYAADARGNKAIGNTIVATNLYNPLHLEGSFGDGKGEGVVWDTILANNVIRDGREAGINIELAPRTICIANTVQNAGYGQTLIDMGIKVFGSPDVILSDNMIVGGRGYAIVLGADSSRSSVVGNKTRDNQKGSLLITDSAREGGEQIQASYDHHIEGNYFTENKVKAERNATIAPVNLFTTSGEVARHHAVNGRSAFQTCYDLNGVATWQFGPVERADGIGFDIFRRTLEIAAIRIDGLGRVKLALPVHDTNQAALAAGLPAGVEYRTSTGERRVVV
ncbi:right-handed parallel beta-helix repeat-containing protein [Sphingomonas silueang]|uniref:right-handed parallel beta-helix repeat-containing protein n=1 Tax=Sphingomonas silueang TaxID=3156617 RepID=UPI0032B60D7B